MSEPTHVEVPFERLSPEALDQLVEEFVTRSGTDYGEVERSLDTKKADVMRQLESGEAVVVFDSETESVNIALAKDVAAIGAEEMDE